MINSVSDRRMLKLIKVRGFALALGNVLAWRPCDRENMHFEITEARFESQIPHSLAWLF